VTRTNSGVTNLVDLNGRSFVFGEEDSAIGDHLSKAALVAAGLRRRHLAQTTNLPSSRALTAVRTGVFDAGAVMWSDLERLKQAGGHLRVLQELRCPSPVWVADTRLDTNALAALRDVFLSLADVNILAEVEPELTGFRPARPSDYDALASQIEQAKQFDEP
jgi:ABC-type phosphate/phosphonate transport system substrate-binding protein